MIYFTLFLYLFIWSYFCKNESARSVHFPLHLIMLKQAPNYCRKNPLSWTYITPVIFFYISDRSLNMPLIFFYIFKSVKALFLYVKEKLTNSPWKNTTWKIPSEVLPPKYCPPENCHPEDCLHEKFCP